MKTNYFLSLLLTLSTSLTFAQWAVNPSPVAGYYYVDDIHFIDNNVGFMGGITALIGGNGKISKTTNGGSSWTDVFSVAGKTVNDFYFVNSNLGFAVGAGGLIAKTTDGGNNWTSQTFINPNTSTPEAFMSVYFVDQNIGYIAGGYYEMMVLKTIDGGANWTPLTMPSYFQRLKSVFFTDANTGYVAGGDDTGGGIGKVYKTVDGGATWDSLVTGIYNNYFNTIVFTDANNGVIGCDVNGLLIKTSDAGQNWTQVTNPAGTSSVQELSFVNANLGYACILTGKIIKTTDGGSNWTLDANVNPNMSALYSISVPTSSYGASAGLFGYYAELTGSTGIDMMVGNDDELSIYPNPTTNVLNINVMDEIEKIIIYDITGKVQHVKLISTDKIDVSNLTEGIYTMQIVLKDKLLHTRFIKN